MKFFDPVNHPKRSENVLTLYPNKVILDGSGSTGKTIDISINGIKNTVIATYDTNYIVTATAWVLANAAFYATKGIVVSNTTTGSATATIVATPKYGWDTVNRFNVIAPTIDTMSATFASTFEPDLGTAKNFVVTLGANTTIKYPKNAKEGDKIRIAFKNPGSYTVAYDLLSYFFPAGDEGTVTTTGYSIVEGVVNEEFYPKYDAIALTGTNGTANITAGGITRLATFGTTEASLDQTGEDFYASWVDDFAAVGVAVTEAAGTITFTPTTKAAALKSVSIKNVSGSTTCLAGTLTTTRGGRVHMNAISLAIAQ